MWKKIGFISVLLSIIISLSFASQNIPKITDYEYQQYMETSEEFKKAEEELTIVYKELLSLLPPDEKKKLREEQIQWIKKRDKFAFNIAPKGSPDYINALVKITNERVEELKNRLLDLKRIAEIKEEQILLNQTQQISNQTQIMAYETDKKLYENPQINNVQENQQVNTYDEKEKFPNFLKFILVSLIIISLLSIILHIKKKLTIYIDYTDALLTNLGVLCPLFLLFINNFFELKCDIIKTFSLLIFSTILFFSFRMSYIANNNIIYAFFSLLSKYTLTFLYGIILLILLFLRFCISSKRKKGETIYEYRLRLEREKLEQSLLIFLINIIYLKLCDAITRIKNWSPISEYFSFTFKKLDTITKIEAIPKVEIKDETDETKKLYKTILIAICGLILIIAGIGGYLYFSGQIGKKPVEVSTVQETPKASESTKEEPKVLESTKLSEEIVQAPSTQESKSKDLSLPASIPESPKQSIINLAKIKRDLNEALKTKGLSNVYAKVDEDLTVTLKGTVNDPRDKMLAVKIAESFRGVKAVRNEITVKNNVLVERNNPTPTTSNIVKALSSTIFNSGRDDFDTYKPDPAKLARDINKSLRNAGISKITAKVDSNLNVVLEGSVESQYEKNKALSIARSFKDVRKVIDKVFVVSVVE